MTPYEIELLLRFHCRAEPLRGVEASPILPETLRGFRELQLVKVNERGDYVAGPALPCYIEAITGIGPPVLEWHCSRFPALRESGDG